MSLGVLIAMRGARESAVAAALGSSSEVTVARRCADLGEAVAAAAAGRGAVVVVSEQPHLTRSVLADIAAAGVGVVGAASSPDAAEHLRSLGIAAVLAPDAAAEDIVEAVVRAARTAPAPAARRSGVARGGERAGRGDVGAGAGGPGDGRPGEAAAASGEEAPASAGADAEAQPRTPGAVVAVWGPAGAPGRTTLAVALAFELAARSEVVLADLDTYGGAVAQALGLLDEAPGIAALARASLHGTLRAETVTRHALAAGPRLRVLSGITRADRWPELSAAALEPVWGELREAADVTVVDCGFCLERDEELQYDTRAPQRNGATLAALAEADVIVAVGSAEPLGVQRLVHALRELDDVVGPGAARVVVVNKVRAAVAGERPREAVADALRRYAGVEQVWTVPWDPQACDAATLSGRALGERAPRSAARKAVVAIAEAVREAALAVAAR